MLFDPIEYGRPCIGSGIRPGGIVAGGLQHNQALFRSVLKAIQHRIHPERVAGKVEIGVGPDCEACA